MSTMEINELIILLIISNGFTGFVDYTYRVYSQSLMKQSLPALAEVFYTWPGVHRLLLIAFHFLWL